MDNKKVLKELNKAMDRLGIVECCRYRSDFPKNGCVCDILGRLIKEISKEASG